MWHLIHPSWFGTYKGPVNVAYSFFPHVCPFSRYVVSCFLSDCILVVLSSPDSTAVNVVSTVCAWLEELCAKLWKLCCYRHFCSDVRALTFYRHPNKAVLCAKWCKDACRNLVVACGSRNKIGSVFGVCSKPHEKSRVKSLLIRV